MLVDAPFNVVTHDIIAAAIEVHRVLGPGLLESAYVPCFHYELAAGQLRFVAQRPLPIVYKGIRLDVEYRLDLIVEDLVVVEVKSVAKLLDMHGAVVGVSRVDRLPGRVVDQLQRPTASFGREEAYPFPPSPPFLRPLTHRD